MGIDIFKKHIQIRYYKGRVKKLIFLTLFGLGIFLLVQIIMPIISYKFWELTSYQKNITLISPAPDNQILGVTVKNINSFPALVADKQNLVRPYNEFTLSVPALKIHQAKVVVDTNDFENNLAHMPGTSLPGEKGNVFITGHSSLPQLFNKNNYKTIFSNLPDIKKGDQIVVEALGQKFIYQVIGLKIVPPEDISVINPPNRVDRFLTLMTCVPPGFYLKRLIVLAELVN